MKALFCINCGTIAVMILAAGCSTAEHGQVAKEWSRMMREEQITPVFPPREDFRVGDIFLSSENPTKDATLTKVLDYLPMPLLLASIPVNGKLKEHYTNRPEFPRTPTNRLENCSEGAKRLAPADEEAVSDVDIFQETNATTRLRHVAFPEFEYARVGKGSLQAVIPIEGLNLLLGANWAKASEGALKISSGESYGLPASALDPSVREVILQPGTNQLKQNYMNLIGPAIEASKKKKAWLTVVTEVFYARTLDVTLSRKRAFGGSVGVNPTDLGQGLDLATNAVAITAALEKLNVELLKQSRVGGSVSVVHASSLGIGLRRTYARPVAVGFRGYVIEVTPCCGNLVISGVYIGAGTKPMKGNFPDS